MQSYQVSRLGLACSENPLNWKKTHWTDDIPKAHSAVDSHQIEFPICNPDF